MERKDRVSVVKGWQKAANEHDMERLLELSDEDIAISGPRGAGYGHGHELLVAWLSRAGLMMEAKRAFARDDSVVVEQHGVWKNLDTGEITGEADFATRFVVEHDRITELARYDGDGGLDLALEEAGLGSEDEV